MGVSGIAPEPVKSVEQGETYWAVMLKIGKSSDGDVKKAFADASERGWNPSLRPLSCHAGAAQAVGRAEDEMAVIIYFRTEDEANRFTKSLPGPGATVVRVQPSCASSDSP